MNTHDIKRYAVSGDIAYPVCEDPEGDYVAYEDHVAAIEADRKRRGEPVAWQPIESAPKDGRQIILTNGEMVAQGWWEHEEPYIRERRDIDGHYIGQDESDGFDGWLDCEGGMQPGPTNWMPLPPAPQPADPSGAPTLHNADSGAQNGIQATQPAAPVKPEAEYLNLDRLADYIADNWPDKKYGLEEICQRLHATWPTAFMPAEPVKVPSDEVDLEEVRRYLDDWGCLDHPGVRALLARYGEPAQPAEWEDFPK